MVKQLSAKEIRETAKKLPKRDQEKLTQEPLTVERLEEMVLRAQAAMRRDLFFGIPWFIAYCLCLLLYGIEWQTGTVLVIGILYFTYSILTNGAYGLNRRRIVVYQELLKKMAS